MSQNQFESRVAPSASQRTRIPRRKRGSRFNNRSALLSLSCHFALLPLRSAEAGPCLVLGKSLRRIFSRLPPTQPWLCPARSPRLLAALPPILGSGDLSCLLLLLKMEFAFLFPILLVAFGCSPAGKGGYANCMDRIQTTSALFTFLYFHFCLKDP